MIYYKRSRNHQKELSPIPPDKKGGFFAIGLVISIKKYTVYNMQSVTSNAVAEALNGKVPVTTIIDSTLANEHDIETIKNWFIDHPEYCTRCQYINLGKTLPTGFDTIFVGSTDPGYFTITIFSWYIPMQSWRYTYGGGWILYNAVDSLIVGNITPITSNAVAKCLSMSYEEKEAGYYFGGKTYHKTFIFSVYIVPNTNYVLSNNFEIPYNKAVGVTAFIINNGGTWSNDVKIYLLSNGTLAIKSTDLGNDYFSVVIDFYYVK